MSSNGLEATRDLANRASICRIRKRPASRTATRSASFSAASLFSRLRFRRHCANGSPVASRGPKTPATISANGVRRLDWIMQNILGCAPLMDGHEAAQERTSNPALSWLRAVALAVERREPARRAADCFRTGGSLRTSRHGNSRQACRRRPRQAASWQLVQAASSETADAVDVDGFTITRTIRYQQPIRRRPMDIKSLHLHQTMNSAPTHQAAPSTYKFPENTGIF